MTVVFLKAFTITAYVYRSNKVYPPYKGRDYDYYAREARISKEIKESLSKENRNKKPARRLNEDLYQEDIPIQELMKQFRGSSIFLWVDCFPDNCLERAVEYAFVRIEPSRLNKRYVLEKKEKKEYS